MSMRQNALNEWLTSTQGITGYHLAPLAGDASVRRYFRLTASHTNYVVMDAPPEQENLASWIRISGILEQHGIHTPKIIAMDLKQGFALIEDLGDTLLATNLTKDNTEPRYQAALKTLIQLQQCPTNNPELPLFNDDHMLKEMQLFNTWFLKGFLDIELNSRATKQLHELFVTLMKHITAQPQCLIHRDYHSRNLLILNEQHHLEIGVIDFQDAMQGPFTYDLVSLIKDCYLYWPEDTQNAWVTDCYHQLPNRSGWSLSEYQHGVDWCGLQRHLKVLGIFSRLHLRDHKSTYLKHVPLILRYMTSCLTQYEPLHSLYDLIEKHVTPTVKQKQPA